MFQYHISPHPKQHLWKVSLHFNQLNHATWQFSLPNWVPGSYLIRDFSRNIIQIEATCNQQPITITQIDKNHWETEASAGEWEITYFVYAFDLSVRGSYLSVERGFFDGACLFLNIEGFENEPRKVILENVPAEWQVATTLPKISKNTFQAHSYAELIDHPVEMGNIEYLHFTAAGIPHHIAISGHHEDFDRERLVNDIQKICTTELEMFPSPAPFKEYIFLLHVGDNIYGGLEHISSTALHADFHCLPPLHMKQPNDDYIQLLGLFSHEYFHAWNVKSIKPSVFIPYQLNQESYTEQLWAFEGITSYYDDLFLVRSGVINTEDYLKLLAKNITRVHQSKGRLKQTLAESSFTAWNKYYKQDENSPNAIVSYYQKGALVALCLDLLIRERSHGHFCLDNVMQQYYLDWCHTHKGIPEKQWQQRCQEITKLDLNDFFQTALYSTQDLPLEECLNSVGIQLHWLPYKRSHGGAVTNQAIKESIADTDFGASYQQNNHDITLTKVFADSCAEQAGLAPKDRIIAMNGLACSNFVKQWERYRINDHIHIHYFRHGVLHETDLTVQQAEANTAVLTITDANLMNKWLK